MSAADITEWIITYLTRLLHIEREQVDTDLPFDSYGLDSKRAAGLVGDLGSWLNRELELTLLVDYATISELSNHLANLTKE